MKPDLDQIYSELDLRPNCSLEEFQHAYRRRIAELHPDRPADGHDSSRNLARLRDLIRVYAMVTRFYRRYGRMPGGYLPQTRSGELPVFIGQGRGPSSRDQDPSNNREGRRTTATLTLVALFIALVVLLASWSWLTGEGRRLNDATPGRGVDRLVVVDLAADGGLSTISLMHLPGSEDSLRLLHELRTASTADDWRELVRQV